VLPLAEPVSPASPPAAARWADPVEPSESAPLMEAEVVEPATHFAEPEDLTGTLFSQSGPYADPGPYQPPLAAAPLSAPPTAKRRKKKGQAGGSGTPKRFSDWVAYAVLFFCLPVAALFTVIGLFVPSPGPGHALTQPLNSPAAANEPPASGYPITLFNAIKRSSGDFSVQYRQDRGPLDRARQYYLVVTDPGGRIELPLPGHVWQQRGGLSGNTTSVPGQFLGPYTMFIEEQVGSSRNRISNDVQVTVSP
jgi:hypothetical protein